MKRQIIGVCPLCNTASVNVYRVGLGYVLAGINDEDPKEYEILFEYDEELDNTVPYFKLGELLIRFDEIMRL